MKVDENTTVSQLFIELARLGVHSMSFNRMSVSPRVSVSAGYGERFAHVNATDELDAFTQLTERVEAGIADELTRGKK